MGFVVPAVSDETSHRQRAVADFHKMAEKRFAEVNENEKDQIHLLIQQYLKTHKNDAVWVECF